MRRVIRAWREAGRGCEGSEITYGEHGPFEHGWWVDPHTWALSAGVCNDWPFGGRIAFTVEVGPFAWHLSLLKRRAS